MKSILFSQIDIEELMKQFAGAVSCSYKIYRFVEYSSNYTALLSLVKTMSKTALNTQQ